MKTDLNYYSVEVYRQPIVNLKSQQNLVRKMLEI